MRTLQKTTAAVASTSATPKARLIIHDKARLTSSQKPANNQVIR